MLPIFRFPTKNENTKLQWPNRKYAFVIRKRCRFRGTIHSLLQEPFQQTEELIQQQKPQIASVMGSVSQLMHAGRYYFHAITHASSGYKSQRIDRAERKKGGGREKRHKKKKETVRRTREQKEEEEGREEAKRKRGEQRRREEVSGRGRHHHQLPLLQNQEPDRARQRVAS